MKDDLDDAAKQRREVFARFGLASYHAQCLERQIGIMVSTSYNREFAKATPEERDIIFDAIFSKTFGKLLRKLATVITIPPNLDQRLTAALKKRNWLIHDYFYDRASHLLSRKGRDQMINELTDIYTEFNQLDEHLDGVMDRWCEKAGITKGVLDHHMERLHQEIQ